MLGRKPALIEPVELAPTSQGWLGRVDAVQQANAQIGIRKSLDDARRGAYRRPLRGVRRGICQAVGRRASMLAQQPPGAWNVREGVLQRRAKPPLANARSTRRLAALGKPSGTSGPSMAIQAKGAAGSNATHAPAA